MRNRTLAAVFGLWLPLTLMPIHAAADDWPMWRYDAGRTAISPAELPAALHLQWVREFPPPTPAFRNARLQFDRGYEPIVVGKTLIVGSSRSDRVTALDVDTGAERWRFYSGGPVRFAPAADEGRVYVGSDDGHLYCLNVEDGALVWKFRAVPSNRKLLGNGRLISVWPVRGGPVVADGVVYFAAGVWSFEGVFVYALDAKTGETIWLNDRTSFLYGQHPHNSEGYGGLTPQGYLVIASDQLVVPCGAAYPATFDRRTGTLKSFELPKQGRLPGGWFAALNTKESRAARRGEVVVDRDQTLDQHEGKMWTGTGQPGLLDSVKIGSSEFSLQDPFPGVEGTVHNILAADGKLFVVTRQGSLYALGSGKITRRRYPHKPQPIAADDLWNTKAGEILRQTGSEHGVALVLGVGSGKLIEALIRQSDMQLVGIDPDAKKIDALRRRYDAAGIDAARVALLAADPIDCGLPPYLATLIVSEDAQAAGIDRTPLFAKRVYRSLRPYGGTAWLPLDEPAQRELEKAVRVAKLPGAKIAHSASAARLSRDGPLPGAVNYTGGWQSADAAVRAPLGVLWFDDRVGHFKRAPQPRLVDGVMISHSKAWEGYLKGDRPPYRLTKATFSDVYTGRVLSPAEQQQAQHLAAKLDLNETQPTQYRPPTQKDAWKPGAPQPGERRSPLTGKTEPRTFPKSYGCDGGIDYGHCFTMRSATAAFYDKRTESGTINISGPRSGCTNSVIPACGVLNVPYFYEGCTCSYPLPTGLAMVNMPEVYEQWTSWGSSPADEIHRVGINFGAPGDRVTHRGTLWLNIPNVGGPSPALKLTTVPENPETFYRHSLWISGGRGWPWVAASGVQGLSEVQLAGLKPGRYTVRLYFAEPAALTAGQRRFDVALQTATVLESFDVAAESGGRMRAVVKQFSDIQVGSEQTLHVELTARQGKPMLSGIELIAEGLPLDELVEINRRDMQQLATPGPRNTN